MKIERIRFAILFFLAVPVFLSGQVEFQTRSYTAPPLLFVDVWNTQAELSEESRVTLYIKIPREHLTYVKTASDSFEAKIETTVIVLDKSNFQVEGWDKKYVYKLARFGETRERHKYYELVETVDLEPGRYKIKIAVQDMESERTDTAEIKLEAYDFQKSNLTVSDVLVGDSLWVDENETSHIEPLAGRPRTKEGPLFGLFHIYAAETLDKFEVEINVHNVLNKRVFQDRKDFDRIGPATPVVFSVGDEFLPMGDYTITVKVRAGGEQAKIERTFRMMWDGFPITAQDMKTALKQLRYIASSKEIKKIKKAHPDSQRQAFVDFWKKHDPEPNTEENEKMQEYYRRIQYANANFRGMMEGWRTDMGMIYIILGPPSTVERDHYNLTGYRSRLSSKTVKALQVWHYHGMNRAFVFIDDTGLGDFRLDNRDALHDVYIRQ